MNKKSQVTTYVILGLVILIVIGIVFFLKSNIIDSLLQQDTQKIKDVPPQIQPIYEHVQDCVKTTSEDALYVIGYHGGYFITPYPFTVDKIPYYFINNKSVVPSKERIESEISKYINQELKFCTNNFTNFTEFKINQGNVNARTFIGENKTLVSVSYPLSINRGEINYQLKDFNLELPIRLNVIYDASKIIIDKQVEDPDNICLSCILELELKNDLYIDMTSYFGDTAVYTFVDSNSILGGEHYGSETEEYYNFRFAMRYG